MVKLKLQYFGHLMPRANSLEKNPDAGKDWRQEEKERGQDGYGITDSKDKSLRKIQEMVKDREVWRAAIYGVAKSRIRLSNWTELKNMECF